MFRKEKIILNQLNGCVEFGSLNALMGPSGAGKTSLLRCLSGRYQTLLTDETRIYLSKFEKIRTCFISQDEREHLLEGLTAKQILIYASKLKNSDKRLDHEMNVKNLMTEFLISDIEDNCVQNCSGGEQKRLAIALELTSQIKPNLICIDEPTSGLDSNAAEVVGFVNNIFL
jgi:ABC-type multidrug transport system ATPase subunit